MIHGLAHADVRVVPAGDRLQDLRFIQALSESSYPIKVPAAYWAKLELLRMFFALSVGVSQGTEAELADFHLDHELPTTRLGRIEKPLIFPHAFFSHLRALWPVSRTTDYSFLGLITPAREKVLNSWLSRQSTSKRIPSAFHYRVNRALAKCCSRVLGGSLRANNRFTFAIEYGSVTLGYSDNGRAFPGKAWDEDYFRMLANSKFVLCPAGDSVWTYRFFESVMCGAIPIVEASAPSYDGFRYYTMEDPLSSVAWTKDIVEHNVRLCQERLTISRQALDAEIANILGGSSSR